MIAIALGATVLAATFISPAIGGPSLRTLVKKEVTKQLDSKFGPPGSQGAQGAQGTQGAQGPQGPTGVAAGTIIATASMAGPPVSSGAYGVSVPIPLSGASWTQAPGELELLYGEITHNGLPAGCSGGVISSGIAGVTVSVSGAPGSFNVNIPTGTPAGPGTATFRKFPGNDQAFVLPPSLSGSHSLDATVSDFCSDNSDFTVTSLSVFAIAHRP